MSFGVGVGDIIRVIELTKDVIKKYRTSPEHLTELSTEISGMQLVLENAMRVLTPHNLDLAEYHRITLQHILEGYEKVLTELRAKYNENYRIAAPTSHGLGSQTRRIAKKLTFDSAAIRDCRQRIAFHNGGLNSFISLVTLQIGVDVQRGVKTLVESRSIQERQELLDWLTPLQAALHRTPEPGTGGWFVGSERFKDWVGQPQTTLFCPGMPGAGKTFIATTVVNHLLTLFPTDQEVGVAFFFCSFSSQHEQRPEDLLGSLLKQLVRGHAIPNCLQELFDQYKSRPLRSRLSIDELCSCLTAVTTLFKRVFIVVDALDEYPARYRTTFLEALFKLQSDSMLNILATSRFIQEVTGFFEERGRTLHVIEIQADEDDVRLFLDGEISRTLHYVQRKPQLKEDVKREIQAAVKGMYVLNRIHTRVDPTTNNGRFLLAQLYLDSIAGSRTPDNVRKKLQDLPKGPNAYDTIYSNTMERIQQQSSRDLAMQVLSWTVWARRPLSVAELQHALSISDGTMMPCEDSITDVEDIFSVCEGLVKLDHESKIIRLAHYTTWEYFSKNRDFWFPDVESNILRTCLSLLSFVSFETGFCQTDAEFESRLDSFALYDYAARNWGAHARSLTAMDDLVLQFLQAGVKLEAASQCLMAYRHYSQEVPRAMTGLHLAAFFGLERGAVALLSGGCDPDPRNTDGRSPLSFAAENGHQQVARALLAHGAQADSRDKTGRTPLSFASQGDFAAIVEILIQHGANPGLEDDFGRLPISYATQYGHVSTVEYLLRRGDVQADCGNSYGITPLGWAAIGGHLATVILLVGCGVQVNSHDNDGMTPAAHAAKGGHEGILKYLLENGADADSVDKKGRPPLSHAAGRGHGSVIRLLLDQTQVDVNRQCHCGRSPISYAAESGNQAVVKEFLSNSRVDPDLPDEDGWTPLIWAADHGWDDVVDTLLKSGQVDVNHKDRYLQTALSVAARMGHRAVIQVLLDKNGTEIDIPDNTGWTPLIQAAKSGDERALDLLLEKGGVNIDPNWQDAAGQTALHWAAALGKEDVVRRLVTGPLDVNVVDKAGRSPLWRAAAKGHKTVTVLLLGAGADVNLANSRHKTPLRAAIENGHYTLAELLLDNGADLDDTSTGEWALLHTTSSTVPLRLQQLLMSKVAVGDVGFFGLEALFSQG